MATIIIPQGIVEKAKKFGVDIQQLVVDILAEKLGMDPEDEAKARLELAKRFLEEGKKLIAEDPIQASEKIYKSAEEAIKAFAVILNLNEILARVRTRGRWTVTDLEKAVRKIAKIFGKEILVGWGEANYLHIWGFHEAKLDRDAIEIRIPYVERMIKILENHLTS